MKKGKGGIAREKVKAMKKLGMKLPSPTHKYPEGMKTVVGLKKIKNMPTFLQVKKSVDKTMGKK